MQVSVSELKLSKSNPQYMPFIPLQSYKTVNGRRIANKINAIDEVDLTITAVLKPLKIMYRP